MPGRLAGKNAIITGAAGGVGLETTILMAQEGASVLMTDVNGGALDKAIVKVQNVVPSMTGRLEKFVVDVAKEADVEKAVAHLDSWGGVDIMFNNAGIMHPKDGDAFEVGDNIWNLTMDINVKGVWYGSKHAVASMRKHKKEKGSIINTASVVALVGSAAPQLAYTTSKGAVLAMTRELAIVHAREGEPLDAVRIQAQEHKLTDQGFRFNSLCPAPLNTPMLQDWLGTDKEKRYRREVHFPSGRFGEAIEQAQAALFLASDESSFVNGTDFVVDGGLTKAYVTAQGPATAAPKNLGN